MNGAAHMGAVERLARFAGTRTVIIGGTGSIGRALASQLQPLGACIVSASRRGAPPADQPAPERGTILEMALDLADNASIAAFTGWLAAAMPAIDLLVFTAGVSWQRALAALDDATIDAVFAANATGQLKLSRDLAPCLKRGTEPVVVNVSSVAARTGLGSNLAYAAAKAAGDAITIGLAKALAPEVRVVGVAPSALANDFARDRPADFLDKTIAATPLGRLAEPVEIANAIIAVARLLTATTGVTIAVDGGRHL